MRTQKALHRAASKSLDGHMRFVVSVNGVLCVMALFDLAHCSRAQIQAAFFSGKLVMPKGVM